MTLRSRLLRCLINLSLVLFFLWAGFCLTLADAGALVVILFLVAFMALLVNNVLYIWR